jgi:hypothetical protein
MLQVSEATILRDWRAAKAWLANELRRARPTAPPPEHRWTLHATSA